MKYFFIALSLLSPFAASANPEFVAKGGGYYCYQDYEDAVKNAEAAATAHANKICAGEAKRVSDFQPLPTMQYCHVRVQAKFSCRDTAADRPEDWQCGGRGFARWCCHKVTGHCWGGPHG